MNQPWRLATAVAAGGNADDNDVGRKVPPYEHSSHAPFLLGTMAAHYVELVHAVLGAVMVDWGLALLLVIRLQFARATGDFIAPTNATTGAYRPLGISDAVVCYYRRQKAPWPAPGLQHGPATYPKNSRTARSASIAPDGLW